MESEEPIVTKTWQDKAKKIFRQNLIVILTLVGCGVGFLVGFLVAPEDPSPSAVTWMGMYLIVFLLFKLVLFFVNVLLSLLCCYWCCYFCFIVLFLLCVCVFFLFFFFFFFFFLFGGRGREGVGGEVESCFFDVFVCLFFCCCFLLLLFFLFSFFGFVLFSFCFVFDLVCVCCWRFYYADSREKCLTGICGQRMSRSAYASVQSDQGFAVR